jgi:hypothetical protein
MGDDSPDRGRRLGHVLGSQHHEDRVDGAVGHGDVDGGGVVARLGIGGNVDGIVDKSGGGQSLAQVRRQLRVQRRDAHPRLFDGVGGHRAGTAGIGDDQHPVAFGCGLQGESGGIVEQRFETVGPADPGPFECGAVGSVLAGENTGVVGGGSGAGSWWSRP